MGERAFEQQPGNRLTHLSERQLERYEEIKHVANMNEDEWATKEEEHSGGMHLFNNYVTKLPGGRHYDRLKRSHEQITHGSELKRSQTNHEFFAAIDKSLVESGLDVDEIAETNRRVDALGVKFSDAKIDNELSEEEIDETGRRFLNALARFHHRTAPAALRLLERGYKPGDIFI